MAHINNYQSIDLSDPAGIKPPATGPAGFFMQTANGLILPYPKQPGIYMLFIPPPLTTRETK